MNRVDSSRLKMLGEPNYPTSRFPNHRREPPMPEPRAVQTHNGVAPLTTPAVYDFSHLDRGTSFSASTHTLTAEPRTPFCESPRPVTERTNTLVSNASGTWRQDTLGGILGSLDNPRMNAIPQGWSESPDGTIGPHSYYSQYPLRYDSCDSDTFGYS